MRAALIEASNTPLEVVDDIDIEEPRTGEVLVRVSHCGLCHSDLSLQNGQFPVMAPTVLGHEAAGVVEAVGDGVTRSRPATRSCCARSPRATSATGACAASTAAASTSPRS